jgi:hypothetical protein
MMRPTRAYAGAMAAAALALAGCGGAQATDTVTVTTTTAAPSATVARHASTAAKRTRPKTHPRRTVSAGRRACDANITVKVGTTSCAFGENVFYGFWTAQDQGDDAFEAYSPVSKRSYAMDCTAGTTVVCRAGDGGEVRFTRAAVDAYSAEQAARYAATHDVGPMDDETAPPQDQGEGGSSERADCDPSYEGACLDPNALDYDCEGGSGDGPRYTGTVTVVGDDHYGLDRDGDGTACDS